MSWTIEETLPIQLGIITLDHIKVTRDAAAFLRLTDCARGYANRCAGQTIGEIDGVQAARTLFRDISIDPTKHRPSSEALLRRALKNKGFHQVNTLVDVGNWCSLDFLLPICVYDAGPISGDVTVRMGRTGEMYLGHNDREVHLENRFAIVDQEGPFGSPMTDSQRTAVTEQTTQAILLIYAPRDMAAERLQHLNETFAERATDVCGGSAIASQVLQPC